jgi:hypothetical protein
VLDFEGDKAEQFHEDVVRLIKKSHTVVSLDKWNGAAEEMSATKLNAGNVKKVAKKLKIDGVISGTVEKRRDEYILRMKLRAGTSGELVGEQVNIKSESAKLDGTAAKDVKDELIEVIATLESNRDGGGGGEEEEEKPKKSGFGGKKPAEDEEEKPKKVVKKPAPAEEEEKPKKSGFGGKKLTADEEEKPKKVVKKPADEEEKPKKVVKKPADEEEKPKKAVKKPAPADEEVALKPKKEEKPKKVEKPVEGEDEEEKPKKPKTVASGEEGDEIEGGVEGGTEVSPIEGDAVYAPSERFLDAAAGMSFTARRMAFSYDAAQVTKRPAGYKQSNPVPGAFFDITAFPLAFGHKRSDILRHIGATVMFDRVLSINSRDPNTGMKLASSEQRFAIGGVFRYPLGKGAAAPVVGGTLRFGQQSFTISGVSEIPSVSYSLFDLSGFFQYPISPKMIVGVDIGALLPLGAGDMTQLINYGRAKITGFEGSGHFDYMIMKNVFARAQLRAETLGYAFLGEGMRSKGVGGARDTYYGGTLTAGFLY